MMLTMMFLFHFCNIDTSSGWDSLVYWVGGLVFFGLVWSTIYRAGCVAIHACTVGNLEEREGWGVMFGYVYHFGERSLGVLCRVRSIFIRGMRLVPWWQTVYSIVQLQYPEKLAILFSSRSFVLIDTIIKSGLYDT